MALDLSNFIDRWRSRPVLVIGDVMLDSYLNGSATRLCQEAPVPVVAITDRQDYPGGAANTAANVQSLGSEVQVLSVIGEDEEGDRLHHLLQQRGISTEYLIRSSARQTLAKQRVLADSHLLVRFDQGNIEAIEHDTEHHLINALTELIPTCEAVIISDYGYGILTPRVIETIATLTLTSPRIIAIDSKQLGTYRHLKPTIVKPNYDEAIRLLGLPKQSSQRVQQLAGYGDRILTLTGAAMVTVTLDVEGVILFERDRDPFHLTTNPAPNSHASGAGDTFISAFTLALTAGATPQAACSIASAATALVVMQPGTTTCTIAPLKQAIARASSSLDLLHSTA